MKKDFSIIYGIHACKSALNSSKFIIQNIYLLKNKQYPSWATSLKNIKYLDKNQFNQLFSEQVVHQGIAMEVEINIKKYSLEDLRQTDKNCIIAILDNITDPHNVGAIIRSAAVFGVKAIIIHDRASCKISGIVTKAASGALEYVQIYNVKNLSMAIKELKTYGFWIVALAENGNEFLNNIDLKGRICIILGAEGSGIRRLQIENSDFVAKLPTTEYFSTLNVSNAAAVAFYEASRQNNFGQNNVEQN